MDIKKFDEIEENKGAEFVKFLIEFKNSLKILESDTVLIFQVAAYLHTFSKEKEKQGYKYGLLVLNRGDRQPFGAINCSGKEPVEYYSEDEFQKIINFKNTLNLRDLTKVIKKK